MDNNNHLERPLPDPKVRRKLFPEGEDDLRTNMPSGPSDGFNNRNSPANDVNSMYIKKQLEEDQQKFNKKYNFNTTEDVPVRGRYIWSEEINGLRRGIEQTNYDEVTDEVTNEEGNSIQRVIDTQNDIVMDIIDNAEGHSNETDSNKTPITKDSANGAPPVKKTARDENSDDEDDDAQRRRVVPYNL